ncbi:uncharacterized protein [Macrobrachium rosenbergii]|uniref:uncharacterized protein n=1 Tax=Macrobrachium rosenbergii TaxID=79674 RepID=UPI0034D553EE
MTSSEESEAHVPADLECVVMRIKAQEKMVLSMTLNHIKELKNLTLELKAKKIYATKEADALHSGGNSEDIQSPDQKAHITAEIFELNRSSLCHKEVRSAFQKAGFNIQVQDVIHDRIRQLDGSADPESTPQIRDILTHIGNNTFVSKNLVSTIEEKEKLDTEILQLRLKALTLIKSIKKKWLDLKDTDITVQEEDAEAVGWKEKVDVRCTKLRVIAHMIQRLILSSGLPWASDNYFLKIMLLCDCVLLKGPDGSFKHIVKHIAMARREKEGSYKQAEVPYEESFDGEQDAEIVDYVTNIPAPLPLQL